MPYWMIKGFFFFFYHSSMLFQKELGEFPEREKPGLKAMCTLSPTSCGTMRAQTLQFRYYKQMLSQHILVLGRQREEDLKTGQPGLHIKVTLLPTLFHLSSQPSQSGRH